MFDEPNMLGRGPAVEGKRIANAEQIAVTRRSYCSDHLVVLAKAEV
jgi:hypothetical protein